MYKYLCQCLWNIFIRFVTRIQRDTLRTPRGLRVKLHLPLVFNLKLPIILSVKQKNVNLILPPDGPFIKHPEFMDILHASNIQTLVYSYNLIVQIKLLNPVAKKLHADSLTVPKRYFSNQHPLWSGTSQNLQGHLVSLLLSAPRAHCALSGKIQLALPTSNKFVHQSVFANIPGQSAWGVLFSHPFFCLFFKQMQFIRTRLTSILDIWYPGTVSCWKFLYDISC